MNRRFGGSDGKSRDDKLRIAQVPYDAMMPSGRLLEDLETRGFHIHVLLFRRDLISFSHCHLEMDMMVFHFTGPT